MNRISHLSTSPDLPRQLCVCIIALYSGCEPTKLKQVIISYYWSALQEMHLSYLLQASKWKAWVLLLEYAVWTREERAIPNTGPSKPSSCFLSKHISSPQERAGEKYPWPSADPPQCHSNSWHERTTAGSLSVSLCNQSRRHCPKSRGVTFCCGAEFKAERQTGRPATLPEPERESHSPATFYSLKKGLSKAWSVCRPCPFMLAVAWYYHLAKIKKCAWTNIAVQLSVIEYMNI